MKYFASDLDGTLIHRGSDIEEKEKLAVKKLIENGYEFIAVSGRVASSVRYFTNQLGVNTYIIGNNGSIILDKDDNIIYHRPISKKALQKLFELSKKHGIEFQMYNENTYHAKVYYDHKVEHLKNIDGSYVVNFEIREDIEDYVIKNNVNIYKYFMYALDERTKDFVEEAKSIEDIEITRSGKNSLDIMAKGVSKGEALKELIKIIGQTKEDNFIVSIGDYNNDISLIEYADFGIAMGNAVSELKEVCDYVTDDFFENGYINAINYVIEKFKEN